MSCAHEKVQLRRRKLSLSEKIDPLKQLRQGSIKGLPSFMKSPSPESHCSIFLTFFEFFFHRCKRKNELGIITIEGRLK